MKNTINLLRGLVPLLALIVALYPPAALGQQPGESPQDETTSVEEQTVDDPFADLEVPEGILGDCVPPSTQEQIMIGVGTLAILVVCFFLLVRIVERRFIVTDRNAWLGRHLGFSLTIFLGALGFLALVYLVTGCLHPKFFWWLGFWALVWLVHLIYTLVVIRS